MGKNFLGSGQAEVKPFQKCGLSDSEDDVLYEASENESYGSERKTYMASVIAELSMKKLSEMVIYEKVSATMHTLRKLSVKNYEACCSLNSYKYIQDRTKCY